MPAEWQTSGVVGVTSMFVPVEWIHAHGLRPVPVIPRADVWHTAVCTGRCPVAAAMTEPDQVPIPTVFATTCDQFRRAFDHSGGPSHERFLLNVPVTRSEWAVQYFAAELERLGEWLCQLGGTKPDRVRLQQSVDAYARLWRMEPLCRGNATASGMVSFLRAALGEPDLAEGRAALESTTGERKPVIGIISGHLTELHLQLFREIENRGIHTRLLCADPIPMAGQLADAPWSDCNTPTDLARVHLEYTPHYVVRSNAGFYQMFWRLARERAIAGVLVLRTAWCDLLEPETITIRTKTGLPTCQVMLGCEPEPVEHALSRIAAFVETLR